MNMTLRRIGARLHLGGPKSLPKGKTFRQPSPTSALRTKTYTKPGKDAYEALHPQNVPHEVAEMTLAHQTGGAVVNAYRRTDYLDQRREVMEKWGVWVTAKLVSP